MMNDSLKWLNKLIQKEMIQIAMITILQSFLAVFGLLYAILFKNLLDSAAEGSLELLHRYSLYFVALLLTQGVTNATLLVLREKASIKIEEKLKNKVLESILYRDYERVSSIHSGEWMNKMTSDVNVIARNVVNLLPSFSWVFTYIISSVFILSRLIPHFIVLLLVFIVLALLFELFFYRRIKAFHKIVQEKDGNLRIFIQECLNSLMVIKSYSNENIIKERSKRFFEEYKEARIIKNKFSVAVNFLFGTAVNGIIVLCAVYSAYAVLNKAISFGTFVAVTQIIVQIRSPISIAYSNIPNFYSMLGSIERLREAETYPLEKGYAEREDNDFDSIMLDSISFAYHDKNNKNHIIDDLTLTINKGEFIGISGPSGCGKSSLLKLLLSLYRPVKGEIILQNGNKKRPLDSACRKLFAYVPQDNQLIKGTIKEIICFGKTYDEEKMKRALGDSCCDNFVYDLKQGIDSELSERGSGLSEGQMQRISIARAIYSDRPILLLDEATSALNEEIETRILSNLRKLKNKTIIMVTHHRKALTNVDKTIICEEKDNEYQWKIIE